MKRIMAIVLTVIFSLCTASCGNANNKQQLEQLQRENDTMISMIKEDEDKIKELEDTLKALTGDTKTAISAVGDGTGKIEFNSLKNMVVFTVPFQYTGESQAPNTSKVNISDNVSVEPSNNWYVKLTGASAELSHPSGIGGIIKVGAIESAIKNDEIRNLVFTPFVDSIPTKTVTYGKLFIGNNQWGECATIETTIDNTNAYIKVGALGIGNTCMTYMFCYKGDTDITRSELIDVLINTIKINNQKLSYN